MMVTPGPKPISSAERAARLRRIQQIARKFGFLGRIEYRHVFSEVGGAQFGLSIRPEEDVLIVYAEAFVREARGDVFSLDAIIAHECGHQVIARNPVLRRFVAGKIAPATEEIMASLIGSVDSEARFGSDSALYQGRGRRGKMWV